MVPSTSTITSGKGGGEPSDIDRDLDVGVRFDRERVACPPRYTAWDWQGGSVMGWDDGRVARRPAPALALSGTDAVATLRRSRSGRPGSRDSTLAVEEPCEVPVQHSLSQPGAIRFPSRSSFAGGKVGTPSWPGEAPGARTVGRYRVN